MAEVKMCDLVENEVATMQYSWNWGTRPPETGFCCSTGQMLLRQQAQNLKRGDALSFAPLAQQQEVPLERSERTQLLAAKLAAEGEADAVKVRNSKLFQQLGEVGGELKRTQAQLSEAQAQAKDGQAKLAGSNEIIARMKMENGKLGDDLAKANHLLEAGPGADSVNEIKSLREQLATAQDQLKKADAEVGKLRHLLEQKNQ